MRTARPDLFALAALLVGLLAAPRPAGAGGYSNPDQGARRVYEPAFDVLCSF